MRSLFSFSILLLLLTVPNRKKSKTLPHDTERERERERREWGEGGGKSSKLIPVLISPCEIHMEQEDTQLFSHHPETGDYNKTSVISGYGQKAERKDSKNKSLPRQEYKHDNKTTEREGHGCNDTIRNIIH